MKRRLLKLGVFLLLGAVVNVAVAWGIAYRLPASFGKPSSEYVFRWPEDDRIWRVALTELVGAKQLHSRVQPWRGTEQQMADWFSCTLVTLGGIPAWSRLHLGPTSPSDPHTILQERICGWPAISMSYRTECDQSTNKWRLSRATLVNQHLLPLEVYWPGSAINTLFYAALLWLLWSAPGAIRRYRTRHRRMREHRCLACNYQIADGVGPNCSECGAKLPTKWSK